MEKGPWGAFRPAENSGNFTAFHLMWQLNYKWLRWLLMCCLISLKFSSDNRAKLLKTVEQGKFPPNFPNFSLGEGGEKPGYKLPVATPASQASKAREGTWCKLYQIAYCSQKSNTERVDLVRCTVNGRTREKANVGWYCILYPFKIRS